MTTKTVQNPYISVVISCYNSSPYIRRLLNSLVTQDFADKMEVIISDDGHNDGYLDIIEEYRMLLDIKVFPTDVHLYHCPGNTRHDGWRHASGDWITFMDHDDIFNPGAFKMVEKYLTENESNKEIVMVRTPIDRADVNGNSFTQLSATTWLHGKFYRRDFLVENGIDFKVDLFGNEDLYFNNFVMGHITGNKKMILDISAPLYKWYANPDSLSNKREAECKDLDYTEKYFGDYLESNSTPHIECLKAYPEQRDHFLNELLQMAMLVFLYYEHAYYKYQDKSLLKDMENEIGKVLVRMRHETGLSMQDIIGWCYADVDRYIANRKAIHDLTGKFIETHSMLEFFTHFDWPMNEQSQSNSAITQDGNIKPLRARKTKKKLD